MFKQHMLATVSYTVIMRALPRMTMPQVGRILTAAARLLPIRPGEAA